MIFSSIQYLLFLPVVVFLYWRTRGGARLALVVVASYLFYMSWSPIYGLLLLLLTAINWSLGLALARLRGPASTEVADGNSAPARTGSGARAVLALGLLLNIGCLCYYKYFNFLVTNLLAAFNWLNAGILHLGAITPPDGLLVELMLPLGISFFVFEFVHYLVDVYKGSAVIKSFMEFAAFASFFPSQIAGPIKRYQDFMVRLRAPETWTSTLFYEGMALFMQGLFKKVAIADPIGVLIQRPFNLLEPLSSPDAVIAALGFVVQVYCDFSGYTDMGRGSALLLGIRLPENFNLPLLAPDLAEFWRRWHMSLSSWIRDYIYFPLGGSRGGRLANWRSLFIAMVACGLWHGASWHYIVFGALQGIGLIANREWKLFCAKLGDWQAVLTSAPVRFIGGMLTFTFITLTYAIFRAPDMPHAFNIMQGIFSFSGQCTLLEPLSRSCILPLTSLYGSFWVITEALKKYPHILGFVRETEPGTILSFSAPVRWASWTAAIILMTAARPSEVIPFVYFQF